MQNAPSNFPLQTATLINWLKPLMDDTCASPPLALLPKKIQRITIDSREVLEGDCFIAICGPHFDGHQFIKEAFRKGARVVICQHRDNLPKDKPCLIVKDTIEALQRVAQQHRQLLNPQVIAITGSNGKTTTKNILAELLSHQGPTLATPRNYNNDIGVPLTLLDLKLKHEYAVVELGASQKNDIERLTHLTQPDIAVITSINAAHLKGFGDMEGLVQTKSEIFATHPNFNHRLKHAIINGDDAYSTHFFTQKIQQINQIKARKSNPVKLWSFGLKEGCDMRAANVQSSAEGLEFDAIFQSKTLHCKSHLLGFHNVYNLLASLMVCLILDFDSAQFLKGIELLTNDKGRLTKVGDNPRLCLIDDSYNANPASVKRAIEFLHIHPHLKVLVLGDMSELGEDAVLYHQQLADDIVIKKPHNQSSIDLVLLVGPMMASLAKRLPTSIHFKDKASLIKYLKKYLKAQNEKVTVVVKGSRSMMMDEVVDAIEREFL